MSIVIPLAGAVLSGGATLAVAGGGLPLRVTYPPNVHLDGVQSNIGGGAVFSADGLHIWAVNYGTSTLRKILISTGAVITSVALAGNPSSVYRFGSSVLTTNYGGAASRLYEVDDVTGAVLQNLLSPLAFANIFFFAVAGKCWISCWPFGAPTEYTWPGLVATGRTYLPAAGGDSFAVANVGGVDYIFGYNTTTGTCQQVRESDLALIRTFAITGTGGPGWPGWATYGWSSFQVGPVDGKLYTRDVYQSTQPGIGALDRWNLATGAFEQRAAWPHIDVGGMAVGQHYRFVHPTFAFSDDQTKLLWLAPTVGSGSNATRVTVRSIQTARAVWTYTFVSSATINTIEVVGNLSNTYGTEGDHRRTVTYYAINGAANTRFTPSTPLAIPVNLGDVLTVTADMSTWPMPPEPVPYISGVAIDAALPTPTPTKRTGYP